MIAPGGEKGFFDRALGGFGEEDVGAALAAPGAVAWIEDRRMRLNEIFLLDGRELDHGELIVGVGEGGEDFSGDAEVGVAHMFSFFGFGEAEGESAKVGGSGRHGALLEESMRARVGGGGNKKS